MDRRIAAANIDDIEDYVATLSEAEQAEVALAEAAIDLALMLHRAREHRGLSPAEAAERAGLPSRAVAQLERPRNTLDLSSLQRYLSALGFVLEIAAIDPGTGAEMGRVCVPPVRASAKRVAGQGRSSARGRVSPVPDQGFRGVRRRHDGGEVA